MPIAFTREVSDSIGRCELTYVERTPIDLERARAQHDKYEAELRRLGCRIVRLLPLPEQPDAVFVQDAAVVFDEVAVVARPGASSRRAETATAVAELQKYRPLRYIEAPGTLDGGDVVVVGRIVFVGQSSRTNRAGYQQLAELLKPFHYDVRPVAISSCLHLMSAVSTIADDAVLINRDWVDATHFSDFEMIDVDPDEPFAANALRVNNHLIVAAQFPKTASKLNRNGLSVVPIDISELAKAEGAVTCCSILLRD